MILQVGEVIITSGASNKVLGTHSKSMILQVGEVIITSGASNKVLGTHSKSMILQVGEVFIFNKKESSIKKQGSRASASNKPPSHLYQRTDGIWW